MPNVLGIDAIFFKLHNEYSQQLNVNNWRDQLKASKEELQIKKAFLFVITKHMWYTWATHRGRSLYFELSIGKRELKNIANNEQSTPNVILPSQDGHSRPYITW